MTNSYLFLKNKVEKRIKWGGESYTFTRSVEDKYHKETGTVSFTVKGLYHQSSSFQQKTTSTGAVTTNKPQPMILAMYEDGHQIKPGDKTVVNGVTLLVTSVLDVQELNAVVQVSLEREE